jgi:hypothetical protein
VFPVAVVVLAALAVALAGGRLGAGSRFACARVGQLRRLGSEGRGHGPPGLPEATTSTPALAGPRLDTSHGGMSPPRLASQQLARALDD